MLWPARPNYVPEWDGSCCFILTYERAVYAGVSYVCAVDRFRDCASYCMVYCMVYGICWQGPPLQLDVTRQQLCAELHIYSFCVESSRACMLHTSQSW